MYLRRHDKSVDGEKYGYWSLVESVLTARGPRQRIVATIGKLLSGKPRQQDSLFEKTAEAPSWATVDLNRVSVERLRHFGDIYLGLLLWHKLGFADFCRGYMPEGRETIAGDGMHPHCGAVLCAFLGTADSGFVVWQDRIG